MSVSPPLSRAGETMTTVFWFTLAQPESFIAQWNNSRNTYPNLNNFWGVAELWKSSGENARVPQKTDAEIRAEMQTENGDLTRTRSTM
eukprot:1744413-Rhodomonas_salina.1